jgi:hypothetical protein
VPKSSACSDIGTDDATSEQPTRTIRTQACTPKFSREKTMSGYPSNVEWELESRPLQWMNAR